jgi:hypothetical protein
MSKIVSIYTENNKKVNKHVKLCEYITLQI